MVFTETTYVVIKDQSYLVKSQKNELLNSWSKILSCKKSSNLALTAEQISQLEIPPRAGNWFPVKTMATL